MEARMNAPTGSTSVSPHPAILLLPAMGVPPTYYNRLVDHWSSQGIAVTQASLSPSALHRTRSRELIGGYAELVEERIPAAYEAARQSSSTMAVLVVGHSLGGQLGLIAAGKYFPEAPMVLIASGSAYYKAFSGARGWLYLVSSQVIALLSKCFGYWPGDRLGFGGRQSTATMRDWARNVRTGRYRSDQASFDHDVALGKFHGPVLAIQVEDDRLAPPHATRLLLAKSPHVSYESITYATSRGQSRPGSHFTWARDVPGILPIIEDWVLRLGGTWSQPNIIEGLRE